MIRQTGDQMTQPFIKITSEGIQFLNEPPECHPQHSEGAKITSGVRRDLTLVVYGKGFVVEHELTVDDALGLIMMLGYDLREKLYVPYPTRKAS